MRILGVDPGLTRLGIGIIDATRPRRVSLVNVQVLRTPAEDDVASRLRALQLQVASILDDFRPEVVAVERVFAQHNVRTVMGTAQVSGVVMALAAERDLMVSARTPSEVKAAVTGYGAANKAQVQNMVARILGLDEVPKPADAADALALAIAEAWRGGAPAATESSPDTPAQRAWREALRKGRT